MRPLALRPCTSPKGPSGLRRKGAAEGSITYKIFGRRVCKVAFMALTGVNAKALQKSPRPVEGHQRHGVTLATAPGKLSRKRPAKEWAARAWLIEFAAKHGNSSPMRPEILLPTGNKYTYYTMYARNMTARGLRNNDIASPDWFMKVWRGIGWIKIRTPMGAFTHCGLCDYLKMVSSTTLDAALKEATLGRLVDHWKFQAAQRVAMDVIFERSAQKPFRPDGCRVGQDGSDKDNDPPNQGVGQHGFLQTGASSRCLVRRALSRDELKSIVLHTFRGLQARLEHGGLRHG